MSPDTTHRWREEIGVYVLGRLPADKAAELEAHVATCRECQADVRELSSVAAVLPSADPAWLVVPVIPPEHLGARVMEATAPTSAGVVPRGRGFVRRFVLAAAAVVVVAASITAYLIARPSPTPEPHPRVEALHFRVVPQGATADGQLLRKGNAIEIRLQVHALPVGAYRMAVTTADGATVSSSEFRTTRAGNWNGVRELPVARSEAVTVAVIQVGGTTQLIADLQSPPA